MKKAIIFLSITLAVCAAPLAVPAQEQRAVELTASGDTLSNADTTYHTLTNIGYYDLIRVSYGVNKVNGTVAGTAQLQGCSDPDGVRWFNIDTVLTFQNQAVNQQTTLINPSSWRHLRVRYYTSGTVTAVAKSDAVLTRSNTVKKE